MIFTRAKSCMSPSDRFCNIQISAKHFLLRCETKKRLITKCWRPTSADTSLRLTMVGTKQKWIRDHEAHHNRLDHHACLLRLRAGHWLCAQTTYEDKQGFLPVWSLASGLDYRVGLHLSQPGCAGSYWHGRLRRQVWHCHEPLLLDRRDTGDGLRGRSYDALLLRLASALRSGILEVAF